jgi:hypothetical protein
LGWRLQFTNANDNHCKFSGKERDSEDNLDYFGARYYGSKRVAVFTPHYQRKLTDEIANCLLSIPMKGLSDKRWV